MSMTQIIYVLLINYLLKILYIKEYFINSFHILSIK